MRKPLIVSLLTLTLACVPSGEGTGDPVRIKVRAGASFSEVTDSLTAKGVITQSRLFRLYGRFTRKTTLVKPGTYELRPAAGFAHVLGKLVSGDVVTARLVVPEGMVLRDIAPRIAAISGVDAESLTVALRDTTLASRFSVPGPGLEGYLYPATYTVPVEVPADSLISELVRTYKRVWTEERRARAEEMGLSERQIVTLASIIEKEAVQADEMPLISSVYHNRLRIGMALQADPTVQYALGEHRERLLYADIERVRNHPYNTYARPGLPPGPIASASERAIDAALNPADTPYLFFVARPDGTHVFTRTLAEHNRARAAIRREQRAQGSAAR